MVLFLDKHSNYLNNKIKQKIICIPFVLTSDDDHLSRLQLRSSLAVSSWFLFKFCFFFFGLLQLYLYLFITFWKLLFRYYEIIYSI